MNQPYDPRQGLQRDRRSPRNTQGDHLVTYTPDIRIAGHPRAFYGHSTRLGEVASALHGCRRVRRERESLVTRSKRTRAAYETDARLSIVPRVCILICALAGTTNLDFRLISVEEA